MKKRMAKKLQKKRIETLNELSQLDQSLGLYSVPEQKNCDWLSYGELDKADADFLVKRENIAGFDKNDS